MIKEFSARVRPAGNKGKLIFTALMLVAASVVLVSMLLERYRGVVGLVGLIAIVVATWIYTKYVAVEYGYDVTFDPQGVPVFVVRQLIGKRQSTFSCVYLHDIVSVEMETREQRRAKKPQNGIRRYVYLPTILAPSSCRITVKSRYEHAEIVIEVTEEFASLLREYVSIAVAARAAEDED